MATWYETAVRFDKMMENGTVKKVTEKFLVDALSFTEAEQRTIEKRTPFISGEFETRAVRRTSISEIFRPEHDRFYLAKLAFILLDEKSGMEKHTITQILVGGDNFDDALDALKEGMRGTMSDWELLSLAESPILEVYGAELNVNE